MTNVLLNQIFMSEKIMKVVIVQHRLMHYREKLFEELRRECNYRGIEIHLVHGQATRRESIKKDEGSLPWAHKVINRFIEVGSKDIIWQPMPEIIRDADLIIIMQENRIISNYLLLLSRLWSRRKVAYWGHGRNFQSVAPSGFREQWKLFLLRHVDWWYAYTNMTVNILKEAGYNLNRITCLNNAIDTKGLKSDLASWEDSELDRERVKLKLPQNALIGVFCGSLYPEKKLDLLVNSADWVREHNANFHMIVIGDGPSMLYLSEASKTRPWIHLVGVKQGREKAKYFRLGHLMLNPGAVGLHIVDAFCSGLVMVTTRNASHGPEIAYLRDGINGVYSGDTAQEYGSTVLNLIENPERVASMSAAALLDCETYTLDNMVDRFADGIESALK
ncbi:MAG: glycosyltransferase family 4 protein [Candidatus Thiodiazotropha taylori]